MTLDDFTSHGYRHINTVNGLKIYCRKTYGKIDTIYSQDGLCECPYCGATGCTYLGSIDKTGYMYDMMAYGTMIAVCDVYCSVSEPAPFCKMFASQDQGDSI